MPVSAVAWVSQAVVFPAFSTLLRPSTDVPTAPSIPRIASETARSWARTGCLSVPVLAPLVPSPRAWSVPLVLAVPLSVARHGAIAALSFVSLQLAPPAACAAGAGAPQYIGLQGDCRAQQEAWTGIWAQTLDGVTLGIVTGTIVVASFALAGFAVGTIQGAGEVVLGRKPRAMPQV